MGTVVIGVVVHWAVVPFGRKTTTSLGSLTVLSEEIVGPKLLG
jgi:hypothetical protein